MMAAAPEFSRPVRIGTIGTEPRSLAIEADGEERLALAQRFRLVEINALSAEADISARHDDIVARGHLRADVTQSCVATGEPVPARVYLPFELVFRPLPADSRPDEEVELSENEMEVIFHDGESIDLGEAVAETLILSLDPYPRAAGAEESLKAAGVKSESEAGPFGALAALRDKMKE